jgi:TatD DNase family protein
MQYIDIHSHLNFKDLEDDLESVLERMRLAETGTIVVGTDLESSEKAVKLAEMHEDIWASVGIHPVDDPKKVWDEEKFKELAQSPKVVAVGECGLDFYHAKRDEDLERQKKLFLDQVHFALERALPLMIHSRNGYTELLEILEPLKQMHGDKLRGNVHFFAGDLEIAKRFWQIGFTTSFTGVVTFAREYDEVIKNAPLEMLMSETDSPFVAPVPYRGKRNEPSYVQYVVAKIAEIRGEDLETVKKALISNASRLFKIGS